MMACLDSLAARKWRFVRETCWKSKHHQVRGTAYPSEALLEAFEAHGESAAIAVRLF